jgi:hypothetical protein
MVAVRGPVEGCLEAQAGGICGSNAGPHLGRCSWFVKRWDGMHLSLDLALAHAVLICKRGALYLSETVSPNSCPVRPRAYEARV